jgi:integrase/recombinase XerD
VFVVDGKGGHPRFTPMANRFSTSVSHCLDAERPSTDTDRVFVVMKDQRRGRPLTAAGLDEVLTGARRRTGLMTGTCHQLRPLV